MDRRWCCVTRSNELAQAGARLAEPGEFTLRAYLNGRIDLPQAEAVRDLIEATTLYQARIAAQQAEGSVSRRLKPVKEQLLELIALLEAGIDFAEDDIERRASRRDPAAASNRCIAAVDELIASFAYGKLVHEGFTLAIVGRPNVGKSSLFNRLLEQDRAIVTDIPGTTRDLVSETAALDGIPVKFVDTAGIRQAQDLVENARHRAQLPGHGGCRSNAGGGRSLGAARSRGSRADRPRAGAGEIFRGRKQIGPAAPSPALTMRFRFQR